MELALLLYVASIAENFRSGLGFFQAIFFIVGIVGIVAFVICAGSSTEESYKSSDFQSLTRGARMGRRTLVVCFYSWVALTLVLHLMPARRDVYVMAGGYVALKAVHSNVVQTTADSALNSIEKWLDKELAKPGVLDDLKKDSKKGNK